MNFRKTYAGVMRLHDHASDTRCEDYDENLML